MNNSIEFKSFLQVTELGTILATEIFKSVGSSLMAGKKVKVKSLSRVQLFATPWTVVYQAPPSMGFSRQEYWSGLPFPSPGGVFPIQGLNPGLLPCRKMLYHLSHQGSPWQGKCLFIKTLLETAANTVSQRQVQVESCVCVGHELVREMIIMRNHKE